jgi:hypothetical protein
MRRRCVEIGQDLLGMWLVDVEFGRIGSKGRRMQHAFFDEPAAQAYVGQALRRRASAPVRIGVAYRCVHSSRSAQGLVSRAGIETAAVGMLIALPSVSTLQGLKSSLPMPVRSASVSAPSASVTVSSAYSQPMRKSPAALL